MAVRSPLFTRYVELAGISSSAARRSRSFDPQQRLPDFADSMVLPRSGDIFKYRAIDADEYAETRASVDDGDHRVRARPVRFSFGDFTADPIGYNTSLLQVLNDD